MGLGYIKIGQPATTLSERKWRVNLPELTKGQQATRCILDEPTTGLHYLNTHKLIEVLHRLVSAGNSVIVIEHNLDVISTADWIVDLGPDGGDKGGHVVYQGYLDGLIREKKSYTSRFLNEFLKRF